MKQLLSRFLYGGAVIFDIAKWLILVLVLIVIINTFFVAVFIVNGSSMDPTFKDKEMILWNKNSYLSKKPERGDIVVINYPGDPKHKKYVKRIVGLPGERIDIHNGELYVNKQKRSEFYLLPGISSEPDGTWILKGNEYFTLGDNRPNSNDSRYFGPVEARFILGRTISIIYPRIRIAKNM